MAKAQIKAQAKKPVVKSKPVIKAVKKPSVASKGKQSKTPISSKNANKPKSNTKAKAAQTPRVAIVKVPKLISPKTPFKQGEFFNVLAEQSSLSKNQVKMVMQALLSIVKVHLTKNGPGQFTLPGLVKITLVTKPATKARPGRNPFTGEEMTIKAKPARKAIKVKALKKFKSELE